MNKTLKLALSAVLGAMLVSPALAQDNFPDVPENHWAYQALENLKDKVLFGYPDGFYRGPRMTSRYEFAVALDKIWKLMMAQFDGVNSKIAAIESKLGGMGGGSDADLKKAVAGLRADVDAMKNWKGSIDTMQKMVREFEPQLKQLGVDVNNMKDQMSDMDKRITALENRTQAVKIGAEVNLLVLGGHSSNGNFGVTRDGRILGEGAGSYNGAPVGIDKDLQVFHEAYITFAGGKEGEPQWDGVLIVGNAFDGLGGLENTLGGTNFSDNTDTTIGFGRFAVTFNSALAGQGFKAQIGRVGHQVGKYLFKRTSFTKEYYQQDWRDNGDFIFDGGIVDFMFGNVNLTLFGGRNSDRNLNSEPGANGVDLNPIGFGGGTVDRTLGVQLGFPLNEMGSIKLAYLWHDSDTRIPDVSPAAGNQPANRLNVYGAEANLKFSNIKFYGAYSASTLSENTGNALDTDNTAWDVALGYEGSNFGASAGYRTIETNFLAAGSWGRVGSWYSPTNVKGFNAMLYFTPSSDVKVWGKGEFLEGDQNIVGDVLGTDDKVTSLKFGVDYKLNNYLDLGLSYEDVKWDFNGLAGSDPFQRWYTFMLGFNMSTNSKLMFTYTYSDVNGQGAVTLPGMPGNGKFRGGLFGTQLKVSF
jgi:hypothetical protein